MRRSISARGSVSGSVMVKSCRDAGMHPCPQARRASPANAALRAGASADEAYDPGLRSATGSRNAFSAVIPHEGWRLSRHKKPDMTDTPDRGTVLALATLIGAGAAMPAFAEGGTREQHMRSMTAIAPDAPKGGMLIGPKMVAIDSIGPMTVFSIIRSTVQLV